MVATSVLPSCRGVDRTPSFRHQARFFSWIDYAGSRLFDRHMTLFCIDYPGTRRFRHQVRVFSCLFSRRSIIIVVITITMLIIVVVILIDNNSHLWFACLVPMDLVGNDPRDRCRCDSVAMSPGSRLSGPHTLENVTLAARKVARARVPRPRRPRTKVSEVVATESDGNWA